MNGRFPKTVARSLLRLRAVGYAIAVPVLAVVWWLHRSADVGILAVAAALALAWNTVQPQRAGTTWALAIDLAGTGLIWWMFGPVPAVYFLLAYVVVIAAILLDRDRALCMITATLALIFGMALVHLVAHALPLFHGTTDDWIDWIGEFGLPLAIVLYTAVIMLNISKVVDESRRDLAGSEKRFRLSFEGAAMGMTMFELEGKITQVNPAFCEQVGYDERTLLTMTWRDIVDEADLEAAECRLRRALEGGTTHWQAEDRFVRSDGSVFWAGIVATLIRDEEGNPHSYFAQTLDISEQKAAEEALAASEERYRSLFEGIPAALYRTDPEGRILDANPALVELLGYPDRDTMLDLDVHDAYVQKAGRKEAIERLEAEGKLIGVEEQLRRYDGSTIWVRDSSRVVLDEHGETAYFEGALTDTTARHQAEEALRESEARLRALFEHAPIGIAAVDLDEQIVAANTELARMLGRPVEELEAMSIADITHPEDQEIDLALREQLLAGEIPSYRFAKRFLHANGHTIWVEFSVTVVHDDQGAPELMIGLIQDITERRKAEADRDQMIKILEATPDLVGIIDVKGHMTYVNRAGREWYGLASQGSLPPLDIAEMIETDSGETVKDIFRTLRTSGWWTGDITLHAPSGATIPGSAVVLPHRDDNGRITHISATFRDLTERIETQRRLEQLVRSKDEFVASVSHELRTPLTAVVGLAEELRSSWKVFSTEEISEFMGLLADQASDVANLVEDLLVAARAEIGKVAIAPRVVEIAQQIESVVAALDEPSQQRITVTARHTETWADPARLRQVIRNLITNAVRYGGRHIEVSTAVEDGFVALRVSDDGPGISPGLEEEIFEPYARDHEPGSQPNSVGLGLTVSRHLARLMGGDLVYSSGERSTFTLTLPERAAAPAQAS
ncbi:aerobic respiration control sensor protein ArcB [bacterium BMS3Abin02]|nr:aerobic respiration control sensor protein ArcB [bacterium BMS3Abin02]